MAALFIGYFTSHLNLKTNKNDSDNNNLKLNDQSPKSSSSSSQKSLKKAESSFDSLSSFLFPDQRKSTQQRLSPPSSQDFNHSGSSAKLNDLNTEQLFKRTYPWQSVYLAENLDSSIEEFLSVIIQNYVLSWYR